MNRNNVTYAGYKRKREDSPKPEPKRTSTQHNGEKESVAHPAKQLKENRQFSTASKTCQRATKKKNDKFNPYHIFSKHNATHNPGLAYCGFHWHSTRLARAGTDMIFNHCKQKFQEFQKDNKIGWEETKEILFQMKKEMDQKYRNMMWHFSKTNCEKCKYWDRVFTEHTANVSISTQDGEPTDEECIKAAMEVDGSSE